MKKLVQSMMAAAVLCVSAGQASAHHSANAEWLTDQVVEMEGVLKEVQNINPHAHWFFDVKGKDGKVVTWDFETVSANQLRRQGISVKDDIKVGETYKFAYSPARHGSEPRGLLVGVYINGKRVDFFSI